LSEADKAIKVVKRAAIVQEKRLRRADMARARALLLSLEEESSSILEEVHGEEWHPHRWIHLVFPTGEAGAREAAPGTGLTHRSVQAFLDADTFAWREVLERVVGKSESSSGGLSARFPPIMLARIDAFVGLFAQGTKRPEWLVRLMARIRRMRNLPSDALVPGPLPRVSRASRSQRALDRFARGVSAAPPRVPSMVLAAPLPCGVVDGIGGAVLDGITIAAPRVLQVVSELHALSEDGGLGVGQPVQTMSAAVVDRPLTPPPRLHRSLAPKRSGYLRSKGANSAIYGMLDGTASYVKAFKSPSPVGRFSLMEESTSFFG